MSKDDRFYIKELKPIREFCFHSDKEDVYKYIYSLQQKVKQLETNIDELKKWLEEEKDRLARECSNIYEDSLGKHRLVNEDIFNELTKVLSKMQELERGKEC